MRKALLITIVALFVLCSSVAFAFENLGEHRIARLNQQDFKNSIEMVFAGRNFVVAHTETDRSNKLRLAFFDLEGWKSHIKEFKGDARCDSPTLISGSSDGKGVSFVWIENDDLGIPKLFCLSATDLQNFGEPRPVDSGMYLKSPVVQIFGNSVHVVYRVRNAVYERVSTDGGNTFSPRIPVYIGDDLDDIPYAIDIDCSSSGRLGLAIAVLEHSVDAQGNEIYVRKIYYYEKNAGSTAPFGNQTLLYGASGDADAPYEDALFPNLAVAFDNNANPWIAWISRNTHSPKIIWLTRAGSVWSSLNSFPHLNNLSSSLRLVRNSYFYNPGIVFFYTKGSGSEVFYRYSISSSSLSSERKINSVSEPVSGYIDAEAFSSKFAVLTLSLPSGDISTLKLWYENLIEQGRTYKKRFNFLKEGFETSDVLNDPLSLVLDNSMVGCYFKETTKRYHSGQKSLWSSGYGNIYGNYRINTDTTVYLNFGGLPGLNYELIFWYLFHRAEDVGDVASGGFSGNLLTLPETGYIWVRGSACRTGELSRVAFKMIADSDDNCGEGLYVDDVSVYGYDLPRPTIQYVGATQSYVRFDVGNFTPGRVSLFRAPYGSEKISLVAESTGSEVVDYPPRPGTYTYFAVTDNGEFESPPSELRTVSWSGLASQNDRHIRIGGADRYLTAVELSKSTFGSAASIVIATGENFPDALSAAPLAAAVGGPILLTKANALPAAVEAEILRLGARKAYIVGGTGVVSEAVRQRLNSLGLETERLGGKDRYETSCMIAEKILAITGTNTVNLVFVATGENYPDALSVSPLAASLEVPILLVKKDVLPAKVSEFFRRVEVMNAVVIGGEGVISKAVESMLPNSKRIFGANRYSTSVEIARFAYGLDAFSRRTVYVATGENFPDALAAGVCAARDGSVMLLVKTSPPLRHETESYLEFMKIYNTVKAVGLKGAVSDETLQRVMQLIQ